MTPFSHFQQSNSIQSYLFHGAFQFGQKIVIFKQIYKIRHFEPNFDQKWHKIIKNYWFSSKTLLILSIKKSKKLIKLFKNNQKWRFPIDPKSSKRPIPLVSSFQSNFRRNQHHLRRGQKVQTLQFLDPKTQKLTKFYKNWQNFIKIDKILIKFANSQ